jgi:amidase
MFRPALLVLAALLLEADSNSSARPFTVVEASIADLQAALRDRRVTSRALVQLYLARIATYEDRLNAAITVNPRALEEAGARDRERAAGQVRGPLHGIPIALKDNIQTTDMPTTGGALAFDGLVPPYEATLTRHLREGGAIILAKTQLTELANWVAGTPAMPANYNSLNGYGFNPYDPRRDPREGTADGRPALTTGGSSSGAGTAASFWAASVGTETSGSILSPATANMLAAIKPTVGRISRHGVIPITADQDTPGPMARTVRDAAILLGVLEGRDPHDPATQTCPPPPRNDYTPFLRRDGLAGARIGIPRAFYYDKITPPRADRPRGGLDGEPRAVMTRAIALLRAQGATVVDPADPPSVVDRDPGNNVLEWGTCADVEEMKARTCSIVFAYGMQRDFNNWLSALGPAAPVKSLSALRRWNVAHQKMGTLKYGQSLLDFSDTIDLELHRPRYQADRANDLRLAATHGIDEVMKAQRLDALLFPGSSGAGIAARAGHPTVIVPFALIAPSAAPPFPPDWKARPGPFGVSFTGLACSEPTLLRLAYGFEQASAGRVAPPGLP